MKIKNIVENKNVYFKDKESISSFIMSNYYSGTPNGIKQEDFTINDDLSVDFKISNVVVDNTHDNYVKINTCKKITISNTCKIYDSDFLPTKATRIDFENPYFYNSVLDINTRCSQIDFDSCMFGDGSFADPVVKNININSWSKKVNFSSCNLKNVFINSNRTTSIHLWYCTNLSYANLYLEKTHSLEITNNILQSFDKISHLNTITTLKTDASYINSFLHIDSLKIDSLNIVDALTANNIITLLVTPTKYISVSLKKSHYYACEMILKTYLKMDVQNRKDYVMDCALELIDAGFEKAAEL